jgi:hypothetical protein
LLARFLLFGVVVGLTELAADAWLVDYTRTLDYSIGGGPMIWRSPLWMPLAWEVVAFRNGQQAVKDAKAACSIMIWKDEHMIDTLAVACAETGDFNSAVQYAAQALAVKGISPDSTKLFQQHLALFQQRKPIRL